jgi:hypothetical protein
MGEGGVGGWKEYIPSFILTARLNT